MFKLLNFWAIKLLESFKTFQKLQVINKVYQRKGSLFMPNMKSVLIPDEAGICKVVHYTHANPVHHGFVKDMQEWKFSSYNAYLSKSPTKLLKGVILEIFGGKEY